MNTNIYIYIYDRICSSSIILLSLYIYTDYGLHRIVLAGRIAGLRIAIKVGVIYKPSGEAIGSLSPIPRAEDSGHPWTEHFI